MVFLICLTVGLLVVGFIVWSAQARGWDTGDTVGASVVSTLALAIVSMFFIGPSMSLTNPDSVVHTQVINIEKASYLAATKAYLLEVDLGNGVTDTIRLEEDDDFEVKVGDRNQFVHRAGINSSGGVYPWDWKSTEPSILLVKEGFIEIKEGM